jgi:rubrerythrin
MTDQLAQPELAAVEIHGLTRGSFILKSALAAGAVYGAGAVTPFVRQALAQSGGGDVDIVNFALTLEYLETAFYQQAAKAKLSSEFAAMAKTFGEEEAQHVDALTATVKKLGGTPAAMPMVDFGTLKTEADVLKLAVVFEDTGVSAYNGAAPMIKSKEVLGAAGSIVQVEARHAAAVRLAAKQDPSPDAFDKTLTKDEVLKAVQPFVKS